MRKRQYLTKKQFDSLLQLSSDIKSFVDENGKQRCGGVHIVWIDKKGVRHNCYLKSYHIPYGLVPQDLFIPNERGFNNTFYEKGE